jgi:hypothetical protein
MTRLYREAFGLEVFVVHGLRIWLTPETGEGMNLRGEGE